MNDTIAQRTIELRTLITNQLTADRALLPGERVVIKACILKGNSVQRTVVIEEGLDAFRRSGNSFYKRALSSNELDMIRNIRFTDQWKQGVVSNILQRHNEPATSQELSAWAIDNGYKRKNHRQIERTLEVWPDTILSTINKVLKDGSHPFRLIKVEQRREGNGQHVDAYRFYRIAERH